MCTWSARGLTGVELVRVIARGVQLSATATYDNELKRTVLNDADNVPYAPICEMMGEVGKTACPRTSTSSGTSSATGCKAGDALMKRAMSSSS